MPNSIGIDPGLTGALALMLGDELMEVQDMPTMIRSQKHLQVNAAELAKILNSWRQVENVVACLELVQAMPGQGVTSMFGFGVSFGIVQGVLGALQIPIMLVTPQSWKKRAGLIGKDKDAARTLAQQLYPAAPLGRKLDIGRADAILIARFGIIEQ